jgi:hypothetical protein
MFQENWDDYREPIKPDPHSGASAQEPADNTDADMEDD